MTVFSSTRLQLKKYSNRKYFSYFIIIMSNIDQQQKKQQTAAPAAAASPSTSSPINNSDDSNNNNDSSSMLPVELVENTYEDIKNSMSQVLLIKLWWRDIGRRVGSHWHHATLFNGSLLIPLAILGYILALELNPPVGLDGEFRHYIAASMGVALIAQFFFTFNGICFENAAMLLAANIVAIAIALRIVVRPLLDYDNEPARKIESIVIESIIGLLCAVHFVTSFLAWHANDGFRRFIFFAIGGTSAVQSKYRVYQSWVACSRVDLLFTTLTCLSIGFFSTVVWWHYLLLAGVVIINAIWRTLLLSTIRTETCIANCFQSDDHHGGEEPNSPNQATNLLTAEGTPNAIAVNNAANADDNENNNNNTSNGNQQQGDAMNNNNDSHQFTDSQKLFGASESTLEAKGLKSTQPSYAIPSWCTFFLVSIINMNSPLVLAFALFSKSFVQATIPDYSKFLVFLSFAIFIGARVLLTIATFFAWRNFGKGMKNVFAKERGVGEFLLGTKSMRASRRQRKANNGGKSSGAGQNNSHTAAANPAFDGDDSDEDPFAAAAKSARGGQYGST